MTRETKVGLLVGMGIILLIGIVVSDHLSSKSQQPPANFSDMGRETFNSLTNSRSYSLPNSVPVATPARTTLLDRADPMPLPNEIVSPPQPSLGEQTSRYPLDPPSNTHYTPQPSEPLSTPDAQPPIEPQPVRRVEDMSEEQAIALGLRSRPVPPMASALEPQQPRTAGVYHTVSNGENLYMIAQRYLGSGEFWTLIRDANPRLVRADGTIMLGSHLLIPSKPQAAMLQANPTANLQSPTPAVVREITVESGQTLSELARKHLGSAADWDELLNANKDKLSRPEQLRAGMTLRLPEKAIKRAAQSTPAVTTTTTTNTVTPSAKSYTIESGDTLSSIAAKTLGSAGKWYKLYQHNKSTIDDPDNLTVGTTIKIPG